MKRPRVSIVVPVYNYARFLPDFFRCLAAQTLPLRDVEIVVVDDGSQDESLTVARDCGQRIGAGAFSCKSIRHLGSPGLVRNVGLQRARGRYALCLDPDDFIYPDFLLLTVAQLDSSPELSLVYTDFERVENGICITVKSPEFSAALLRTQNILPMAVLCRREVFEGCGGFRDDTAYEDWEMWTRAVAAGFQPARVPGVLYRHVVHGRNFSLRARQEDGRAKAAIVLANKSFFAPEVVQWARGVASGAPWAIDFGRGLIPRAQDVRKMQGIATSVLTRQHEVD